MKRSLYLQFKKVYLQLLRLVRASEETKHLEEGLHQTFEQIEKKYEQEKRDNN